MSWYKRKAKGITTKTVDKKEVPSGIWVQCKNCKKATTSKKLQDNHHVCPHCDYHMRIGSQQYFQVLFDEQKYQLLFDNLHSQDALGFTDLKPYTQRLEKAQHKTGLTDAMQVAIGQLSGKGLLIAAMDFQFIGGSMGSVVGEKISLSIQHCLKNRVPLLIISKSGGARMMESPFSLMQMAKTTAQLSLLQEAKIPYISLLTDPTTGGVTASFAMLGDLNIAEPNALIGFAGPRIIKETIKKELPEGFQRSEFVLEHGFLDLIVHRKDLKSKLAELFGYLFWNE